MRLITNEELFAVAGGFGDDDDDGEMPVVTIRASREDQQSARNEYFLDNAGPYISAAAGIGAGAVVTGLCVGIPAALSGPAAPGVVAMLSRPCAFVGATVGAGVAASTSTYMRKALR